MLKQIPNILTGGRLVLAMVFLPMIFFEPKLAARSDTSFYHDVAFVIYVIAGLTDIIDGAIARKYNMISRFGRIVDPLADKILLCGALIVFAIIGEPKLFNLNKYVLLIIHWLVVAIVIARDVYVTILRHIAEAKGINFAAVFSGKLKVFLQYFTIGTITIKMAHVQTAEWGYWFTTITIIIMIIVTMISGLTYHIRWKRLCFPKE